MESLEVAQFLPRKRAVSIVQAVVDTSAVKDQERDLRFRAPVFARNLLGYKSLSAAEELSNYSYVATMGHLDFMVDGTARVTLFGKMSWLGPPNTQDRQKPGAAYDLRILYLTRVNRSNGKTTYKWKLIGWEEAPNQPTTKANETLSPERAKSLYDPLIKDFQNL
jgi:hypothetical protein